MCCRKDTVVVNMLGTEAAFEILNVMEYSSARGRMSVIARAPGGSVRLLSKGSDAKVIGILHAGVPKALLDATNSNLHLFATQVRAQTGRASPDGLTCSISTVQWHLVRCTRSTCLGHVVWKSSLLMPRCALLACVKRFCASSARQALLCL